MAIQDRGQVSATKSARGLDALRFWRALGYSLAGFRSAYATESAFRQEVWAFALLMPLAFWIPVDSGDRLLLIGSLVVVLVVELLNSAVEAAVDRISSEHHELSARAKDYGSAAVLLSLLLAAAVWGTVLWPLFFSASGHNN
jgi:diacylglycerol kinase (ATP)